MDLVLSGIKVIEVSMWAYVPAAGAVLAEWGADVVKVESPDGDPIRGLVVGKMAGEEGAPQYPWEVWNRNKRAVAIDLKQVEGQQILHDLVADADVFLTSILPGSRPKMGIDADTIRAKCSNIIYAAGTASGGLGPEGGKGGFDSISFWARGGLSAGVTLEGHDPIRSPSGALGDSMSGLALAGGVAAALVNRNRTGEGCVVEGALLGTAMWVMQMAIVGAHQAGIPEIPRASRQMPHNPLVNNYRTSDDRWIALDMLQSEVYWAAFCRTIGREDLITDPRFEDVHSRDENVSECVAELDKTFLTKPLDYWKKTLSTQRGQWDVHQRAGELVEDPQAVANDFVQTVDYGNGHTMPLISSPIRFDRKSPTLTPAPQLSADTDNVLASLGWTEEQIIDAKIRGVVG